jgi:hypothetical protein
MKAFTHYVWQVTKVICAIAVCLFIAGSIYGWAKRNDMQRNVEKLFPGGSKVTLVDENNKVLFAGDRKEAEKWALANPHLNGCDQMLFTLVKQGQSTMWARVSSTNVSDANFDNLKITEITSRGPKDIPIGNINGLEILQLFGDAERVEGAIYIRDNAVVDGSYVSVTR